MRGDLDFMHCYAGGIGTLFAHTFALEVFPLCCRAWRLSSLEKRSSRSRSRFREVPTWREGIFVLVFKINKDVMSFFFPNHCSMCDWISVSDHMMMLFRSFVYVYLIIIVLYVVIMVWGRYNLFCRSLGARGARRGLKRKLGPAFSLSGVDLSHLWNLLLYTCWTLCISLSTPVRWWPLKP